MLKIEDKHFFYYYVMSECERIEGILMYVRKKNLGKTLPPKFERGVSRMIDKIVAIRKAVEDYKAETLAFFDSSNERHMITDAIYAFNEHMGNVLKDVPKNFDLGNPYKPEDLDPKYLSLAFFMEPAVDGWKKVGDAED